MFILYYINFSNTFAREKNEYTERDSRCSVLQHAWVGPHMPASVLGVVCGLPVFNQSGHCGRWEGHSSSLIDAANLTGFEIGTRKGVIFKPKLIDVSTRVEHDYLD